MTHQRRRRCVFSLLAKNSTHKSSISERRLLRCTAAATEEGAERKERGSLPNPPAAMQESKERGREAQEASEQRDTGKENKQRHGGGGNGETRATP